MIATAIAHVRPIRGDSRHAEQYPKKTEPMHEIISHENGHFNLYF